jgi:uncharacterized protein YciI
MSETSKPGTFIVFAPDIEGGVDQRLKIRPQHLVGLKAHVEEGFISMSENLK